LGVLGLVLWLWTVDRSAPAPRGAAAAGPVAAGGTSSPHPAPVATPIDVSSLLQALRRDPSHRPPLNPRAARRDLFTLTEAMRLALRIAPQAAGSAGDGGEPRETKRRPPFEKRHTLYGTLVGPVPLALIDDLLLSRNARLEDYRLVEIAHDYVTFESPQGRRVRLDVSGVPDMMDANSRRAD